MARRRVVWMVAFCGSLPGVAYAAYAIVQAFQAPFRFDIGARYVY